ncbi:hypothetical protein ACIRBZ_47125 [Streptomyces sp. NPDC094038]|uniref:hypothetical protein n=1 Tax=Streptomyces sp. NPDC094038 TaxID=3366055 RepID=UPI003828989C
MLTPLLAFGSTQSALVVNGLTFLGSTAAVGAIRVPAPPSGQTGLWSDLTARLRAVRTAPDVLVIIVTFVLARALALTNGFLTVGLVAVAGQGGQYGLLLGVAGVDGLAGVGAGARRPATVHRLLGGKGRPDGGRPDQWH